MAQKRDTPALIAAFLLTAALLSAGVWWFSRQFNLNALLSGTGSPGQSPTSSPISTPPSSGNSFADVANVPAGLFAYGGSTTWAPIRGTVDPALQQAHPGFQLRYTNPTTGTPGSGSGIRMLIDNQLAFAQSSRSVNPNEFQAAQQRGFTLREVPVALEGIAIAVHPNLPIAGLTIDQIRGIYTGQITNWSQVGGPNLAITPYSRRLEDGGTVEFFVDNLLNGAPFAPGVQPIATTTEALRAVSSNPGGVYYASAPEVVGQCTVKPLAVGQTADQLVAPYIEPLVPLSQCPAQRNQVNADALRSGAYPITRPLLVVIKETGQIDQQAGEAYANLLLTNQGQELLGEAGFVRLR
ncbi:MAG: PstS family phosphate ABC transporter substrate-binding protein [Synechococcales bacterium]|nr:PstS family phosphate ABC transporter substrate-binding protein [Synechococcales bacterium]